MTVPTDLDRRFRETAARSQLLDAAYDVIDSELGPLLAAVTDRGLARISFDPEPEQELESLAQLAGRRVLRSPRALDETRRELEDYFGGRRTAFDLALDMRGLSEFTLRVGQPVGPMLAQTATGVGEALERLGGEAVFEAKLDGARVQIHRAGNDVSIYTRSLDDVTARLPEVVEATLALPVTSLIADGEAIALRPDGRPHRFQVTASRFGRGGGRGVKDRSVDIAAARAAQPLSVFFFDILHLDGVDLLDEPTRERLSALDAIAPSDQRVDRLFTSDTQAAQQFLDATLTAGHEGLMAKSPSAPYEAGRRGAGWLKVKPVHTLDLVVLAVEWGSGRRTGKLSNIHLGARDPESGNFVMLGKTFKGMTDAMLAWQTARFGALALGSTDGYVVKVRPEQVVEIAYDGVQGSTRYPGGMALRFARVLRYRDDKSADEADTVETVRSLRSG